MPHTQTIADDICIVRSMHTEQINHDPARQWSAGFLSSRFHGVQFYSKGAPVHYVGNPDGVCQSTQRQVIDEIARLNGLQAEESLDPEIQTRVAQYELAFKMQTSVPELADLSAEFGRTPMGQGTGRDHHINAFSVWMAGAGIRGGLTWGSTDELGYRYLKDGQEMHVHDLHATMLATFGIDHTKLVHRYQGRDFRLTDVHGKVAHGIFA